MEAQQVDQVLRRLEASGLREYVVAGSVALAAHTGTLRRATFGDLDLVVRSFEALPHELPAEFLCIHAHPHASGGRLMLQLADSQTRARIDIFGAQGAVMARADDLALSGREVRIASVEDIAARVIRSLTALGRDQRVPAKFAASWRALRYVADAQKLTEAWRSLDAESDIPTNAAIEQLLLDRAALLVEEEYADQPGSACDRCVPVGRIAPAPPQRIIDILGYR